MEKRAEDGSNFSSSSGHHYEDVSDKTLFIKSMLRTITNDVQHKSIRASSPSANSHGIHEDSDFSCNSDSMEASVTDQNPSNAQSDIDDMATEPVPMETHQDVSTPIPKHSTIAPQRVVKKKLILNPDLKAAHRIVMQIMSDRANYAFMDEVDVEALKLWDYHERVKEPMWLTKIEDKFDNEEYSNITQVIRDLRLTLENCYRYNGLDHYVSKQAMKIEQVLETKLSLLPRVLQVQTTLYVTSDGKFGEPPVNTASTSLTGRRRTSGRFHSGGATTPLSNCIQSEILLAQAGVKKRQQQERQEELLMYRRELDEWEKDLLQEPKQDHLKAMWEIPAIGQFLLLFQESLALNEISYYELERCFLMPQESKLLAQIFTCLLSSPTQRKREISKNMGMAMSYKIWQRKLNERVQKWYQIADNLEDTQWAASDLGIDVHFFEVMGDKFPLNDYQYHELTYYQRVILMKAVCDNCLEMQPTLRQCLEVQPNTDQRAIMLGEDSSGNTYVHFPQFCGYYLRIYKQAPFPEPELRYIEVDEPDEPVKVESNGSVETSKMKENVEEAEEVEIPEPRKRPSNLRQKLTPIINSLSHSGRRRSRTSKSSQELSSACGQSAIANSNHLSNPSDSKSQSDDVKLISEDKSMKDNLVIPNDNKNIVQEECVEKLKENILEKVPDLTSREGSKDISADQVTLPRSDIKKEENHNNSNSMRPSDYVAEDHICNNKPIITKLTENHQKLNGQIEIQTENLVSNINVKESKTPGKESTCESSSFDMQVKEENDIKDSDVVGQEKEGTIDKEVVTTDRVEDEEVKSIETENEKSSLEDMETNSQVDEEPMNPKVELPEVEPERAAFELVCDSIESLRSLVAEFAEREPVEVMKGRRKKIIEPPPRTESEVKLHETLTRLLVELAPHESKLCNAAVRVKERLRKEFDNFQDSQEESDSWESESSSGSSSSSDSDSSDSDDEDEKVEKNEDKYKSKVEEKEEEPVDEEEEMETLEPFLGISTRAQKISKKKKLIEAKKRAKIIGNEDQTEAKKQRLSSVDTPTSFPAIPTQDSFPTGKLATVQKSPISVNIDNIYQTLQNKIAAACHQPQGYHSMTSSRSIPENSQSQPNLIKTKPAASPACTIVVDDVIWKEIQNDPQRQKEVVLKYLLQQRQKLSSQRDLKLQTTLSSQEIHHAAIGDANKTPSVTAPIPKSSLLSIPPEAFGLPPVCKQPTPGQPPVLLSSSQTAMDSQEKSRQIKHLQTMLREPQRKVESTQKEILLSKLSANSYIPTLSSTTSSPTLNIGLNIPHSSLVTSAGKTYTPSHDRSQLTEAQIKENQLNQAKKQKENMLAQQWLQQLLLLQQSTSKASGLSKPHVQFTQASVKPIGQVSTTANIRPPSGVETTVRTLPSTQLITQAAKLLQKKPNKNNTTGYLERVKKIQQLPNGSKGAVLAPTLISTSIPSTGVKTIADGNLLKIQNHATSTSDQNDTAKGNQEIVVSLEYLQKLQQQAKLKQNNAMLINQQVTTIPQNSANRNLIILNTSVNHNSDNATSSTENMSSGGMNQNAVTFTNSQSSISPHAVKFLPAVANPQIVHQQSVATNQGQICLVKMSNGTLRALNLVQQKAPVKKKILTSSLLTNRSNHIHINTPAPQTALSMVMNKPQSGSTLIIQNAPAVTDPSQVSGVKTAPSMVLPSHIPVHATKATLPSRNTTSQSVLVKQNTSVSKIILSAEEYKSYMHLGVLPSRFNQQNQSQTTEGSVSHDSLQGLEEVAMVNAMVNTGGNGDSTSSMQDNYQDTVGSSTSITSCANMTVSELLARKRAINEGAQNNVNQE